MKSLTGSQGAVLVSDLLGLSPFWGVSRQNTRRKIKSWMENQHLVCGVVAVVHRDSLED
jgi:hypothetical protein